MKSEKSSLPGLPPGPLVIDVGGLELTAEDHELISHPLTGGIVLFARNYHDRAQLTELTRQIRASRDGPLLISVDQEGGRVQRFKEGFTPIPPMRRFGELYDQDPEDAVRQLTCAATLLAWELRECGIDFSYAPVADLDRDLCPAIGDRALHPTTEGVCVLAAAVMHGLADAGCSNVIKHFPGHGSVAVDTHKDFARDHRSFTDIQQTDAEPFRRLHQQATAVMMAHVIYEQVDAQPASLSRLWQTEILREQMQYRGVIVSDDLSMSAITKSMPQADAAAIAIAAGSDLALICNDRSAACVAFDHPDIPVGSQQQFERRLRLAASEVQTPQEAMLIATRENIAALVCQGAS